MITAMQEERFNYKEHAMIFMEFDLNEYNGHIPTLDENELVVAK